MQYTFLTTVFPFKLYGKFHSEATNLRNFVLYNRRLRENILNIRFRYVIQRYIYIFMLPIE